jgi:hypothetical protein
MIIVMREREGKAGGGEGISTCREQEFHIGDK